LCPLILHDNALESCELLGEDEERFIKCNFSVYKQYLSIEIINPVRSYEKGFKTRKANKELHGIGLVSVRAAVEKNDGFSYFGVDDGQFRSKIMLNL
jgi:sensor histidine kinase regulating citrate/malate metabolism